MISGVTVYDIDWENNAASVVTYLHNHGCIAIAYLEAGDWTPDRSDAGLFLAADKGGGISGWPGEKYLDVRSSNVRSLMAARLDVIKAKGFDAVEPDVLDAWDNGGGGFTPAITAQDEIDYCIWLTQQCHARGLSIGLKGNNGQVGALYTYFDWALNEECNAYSECFSAPNSYALFINTNKAVFNCEYTAISSAKCTQMANGHINSMRRNLDLTASGVRTPCIPDTQNTW
jgi:hypothetical protein